MSPRRELAVGDRVGWGLKLICHGGWIWSWDSGSRRSSRLGIETATKTRSETRRPGWHQREAGRHGAGLAVGDRAGWGLKQGAALTPHSSVSAARISRRMRIQKSRAERGGARRRCQPSPRPACGRRGPSRRDPRNAAKAAGNIASLSRSGGCHARLRAAPRRPGGRLARHRGEAGVAGEPRSAREPRAAADLSEEPRPGPGADESQDGAPLARRAPGPCATLRKVASRLVQSSSGRHVRRCSGRSSPRPRRRARGRPRARRARSRRPRCGRVRPTGAGPSRVA